jgi:hypothetical protein
MSEEKMSREEMSGKKWVGEEKGWGRNVRESNGPGRTDYKPYK